MVGSGIGMKAFIAAAANFPVDGVDSGSGDLDKDLPVARLGIVPLFILQLFGPRRTRGAQLLS